MQGKRLYRPAALMKNGYEQEVNESVQLSFYADVVNNRNLEASTFFDYLKKKYNFRSFYSIFEKIDRLEYRVSFAKARTLRVIINYKRACLDSNYEKIDELKEEFNKIKDVITYTKKSSISSLEKKNVPLKWHGSKEPNELSNKINSKIDDYLNGKEFSTEEYKLLRVNISQHMNLVDKDKYTELIIKKVEVEKIKVQDLDDLIEVLKYFIYNLDNNLLKMDQCKKLFETQKNEDAISIFKNIHVEGEKLQEEKCDNMIDLCKWKLQKMRKYLKIYNRALNDINSFKNTIENNRTGLCDLKISSNGIDDEFIKEVLSNISLFLKGYRQVSKVMTADKTRKMMKEEYIKKLYQ